MSARKLVVAIVLAVTVFGVAPATARAGQASLDVSLSFFHDRLSGYGTWVNTGRYGSVWAPRGVAFGWRPYTVGSWAYTDYGWTWVSDEPWGWAAYHYGRWEFDPDYGWIWVPDTVWGPAWVAWRSSNDYIGWAPLAPGFDVRVMVEPVIAPFAFSFVRVGYLTSPHVLTYVEPVARNTTFVRLTINATHFSPVGTRLINEGVRVDVVERSLGHAVPRLTIEASAREASSIDRDRLLLYRPDVVGARPGPPLAASRTAQPVARVESPAAMAARHAQELRDVDRAQAASRAALEVRHQEELAKPPAGLTREQIVARQEQEHHAQQEEDARQKQVVTARQARERTGRGGR
jgi:hypothetical protein